VWRALELAVVLLAAGVAVYTGLLLRSMQYISAWQPWTLTALFVASALSGGTAALVLATGAAVSLGITGEGSADLRAAAGGLDAVFLAAEALLLVAYVVTLRRGGPAEAGAARLLLAGRLWPAFLILVVGAGLVTPFAVRFIAPVEGWVEAAGVAFAVLAGGFTLRLAVLWAGAKEGPPLRQLSEWRAAARGSGAPVLPGAAGAPAEPVVIRVEA
jgi:formate-dependent nitrite reductase membrane component NrfD